MRSVIRFLVVAMVSSFLVKCATIAAPQGGPKDTQPPKLITSSTENYSTNFKASNIVLSFDEFIKLDNPTQNITTSPPLVNKANFNATKNKLFITFKEPLEADITYHLNFGNSIVDLNESNPLPNFQFIFSTGEKIDSIAFNGSLDLINDTKISNTTLVGLYRDFEDSIFYKEAPFYYSLVKEDGSFEFTNLKNGSYQVIALADLNGNKYYDMPTEAVGFLTDKINLDSNLSNLKIPLFISEPETYRILSFSNNINNYLINYEFSKSLAYKDSLSVEFLNQDSTYYFNYKVASDRRKVIVNLDARIDSFTNIVSVVKINNILVDTFQHSISGLKKPTQEYSLKSPKIILGDSIIINATLPVISIENKIAIIDTLKQDTVRFSINQNIDNQLFVTYDKDLLKKNVYTLLIEDSVLVDQFERFNESIKMPLEILDIEDAGLLKLNFEDADSSIQYILNILDETKKIVHSKIINFKDVSWTLPYLLPAKYTIQIIEDTNLNGVWNSGSIVNRTFPEKISTFSKEINVRPNWELEETINFSRP